MAKNYRLYSEFRVLYINWLSLKCLINILWCVCFFCFRVFFVSCIGCHQVHWVFLHEAVMVRGEVVPRFTVGCVPTRRVVDGYTATVYWSWGVNTCILFKTILFLGKHRRFNSPCFVESQQLLFRLGNFLEKQTRARIVRVIMKRVETNVTGTTAKISDILLRLRLFLGVIVLGKVAERWHRIGI